MHGCRNITAIAAVIAFVLAGTDEVAAQLSQAWTWCVNKERGSRDLQIGGCTTVIQSGRENRKNLAIAFRNRADAYSAKGEHDRAIADYNESIRLDRKNPYTFNARGWYFSKQKNFDRAIKDYDKAIRLNAKLPFVYNNRGLAYSAKKDYDRAIADYNRAIRLDRKKAHLFRNRGEAYFDKKDYDRAIADYSRAIRLDPKRRRSFAIRGLAYHAKKDYDRAIADFDEVVRLKPKLAWGYNARGDAYRGKKDYERAAAEYEQAIRLDPKSTVSVDNLRKVYRSLSSPAVAISTFERVLAVREKALGPEHPHVGRSLYDLALVYQHFGRHAEAIPFLERALIIRRKFPQKLGPEDHVSWTISASTVMDARIAARWAPTCEPLKARTLSILKSAGRTANTFNKALSALQEIDEKLPESCPWPLKFFGGNISHIIQCPANNTVFVQLTDGSELILTDSTNALGYGLPKSTNEFVMGIIDQHYYCIAQVSPLTIYTGQVVQAIARRDYDKDDPTLAATLLPRADARQSVDLDRRVKRHSDEIQLEPDNSSAYEARAKAYHDKKDYDLAITDYDQAIRLNPRSATAFCGRGLARARKGEQGLALTDIDKAISIETHTGTITQCYEERVTIFERQGNFNHALAAQKEIESYSATSYNARCWLRALGDGDLKKAISDCNEALRLAPDFASALDSRGFVYLKRGEFDKAIADFDAALTLKPELAESLYGRGLAKTRKGDKAGGDVDIAAAKQIKADIVEVYRRYLQFRRGWLGILPEESLSDSAYERETEVLLGHKKGQGAPVKEVVDASPAKVGGIEPGDIIVKFDGTAIKAIDDLVPVIADSSEDKEIEIRLIRNGQELLKKVKLERLVDKARSEVFRGSRLGVSYQEIGEELARKLRLQNPHGALVTSALDEGAAKAAGIEAGDVISKIDGTVIKKAKDLPPIIFGKPDGHESEIVLIRKGQEITKKVKLGRVTERTY